VCYRRRIRCVKKQHIALRGLGSLVDIWTGPCYTRGIVKQKERQMRALQTFIDQKNHWNRFFDGEQYEIQTAQGRQRVADMIDASLSPENLTCDGELPRAEVNRRYRELITAAKQLKALDPAVTFYEWAAEIG
jgi:hypothetical protein